MSRRNRRSESSSSIGRQLRRPAVQLGILLAAVAVAAFIIIVGQPTEAGFPREVSVAEAYALYGQEDIFFLDVRQPEEWNEYHAPNSTLIPLGELAARVNEVPRDKKIVVVCRSGNRSQEGRDILLNAGFENVTSMNGGLVNWQQAGYPTVSGP